MFVIISGVTASGKNTIMEKLFERHADWGKYKSYTTRPKRSEDDGYNHVSKEEFEKLIKEGKMLEYALVHNNNYYGTPKKAIDEALEKYPVVLHDLDVIGTMNVLNMGYDAISIFVDVDEDRTIIERLQKRGDSAEDIAARLKRCDFERSFKNKYTYVVENIILEKCVDEIEDLITAELNKRKK